MLAIASIAVVSCKKDNQENSINKFERSFYEPPKIDDYDAYLGGFKQRIIGTRTSETMSLEEASWHLSSVANYDFGHANSVASDILYDTLYGSVKVTDGLVTLSDLGQAYVDIANAIDSLYQSLNLDNKHIKFIDVKIEENGLVTVPLIITYTIWGHFWFYPDSTYADSMCQIFFPYGQLYTLDGTGMEAIRDALNLTLSKPTQQNSGTSYYIVTREKSFYFEDYTGDLASPFCYHSRLCATTGSYHAEMSYDWLCYCLDSYLGLGCQYRLLDEDIISWDIEYNYGSSKAPEIGNHQLYVRYGHEVNHNHGDN